MPADQMNNPILINKIYSEAFGFFVSYSNSLVDPQLKNEEMKKI
jgi:hypothetical protein